MQTEVDYSGVGNMENYGRLSKGTYLYQADLKRARNKKKNKPFACVAN